MAMKFDPYESLLKINRDLRHFIWLVIGGWILSIVGLLAAMFWLISTIESTELK